MSSSNTNNHNSTLTDLQDREKLAEIRQIVAAIAGKMAVPLFFLFWILDILYVPQFKWEFLGIRTLIIPTALLTLWWLKQARTFRQVERAAVFLLFMCAAIINVMIYRIGEGTLYAIPLQLVAIGGLSFFPFSHRYFGYALLAIYGPYYTIELSRIEQASNIDHLSVYTFFILGVIVITRVIHFFRERLRARELAIRMDLEAEVAHRKQTEQELIVARDQALAATRAKDSFFANMSHEIRTPLTAIIGFAEYSLDQRLPVEERHTALGTIVSSGNHLLSIINDILDFSKIEADSIEIEPLSMDPIELAAEVQSLIMQLAGKKGLVVDIAYRFPLPTRIISDRTRLKQILINLCGNAIKFTERGIITLTLEFDCERNAMLYRIQDTGIGMTAEQLARIFEPFKQADSSITRRYGGTGLGLSLSRRLAQVLGGSLEVNSQLNVGSEFIVAIAAGDLQGVIFIDHLGLAEAQAAAEPSVQPEVRLRGKVLLAEDNENNQQLLSLYLRKMGVEVTLAENGAIALARARQQTYDLILMDMQMPVLSGVDAVRQLRQLGYPLPIVALTANATKEDRRQCLEAGCDDFVTKPVMREHLYQTVAKFLAPARDRMSDLTPLTSTLLAEDPEFSDIVTVFIDKLPGLIASIRHAYTNNDWTKLHELIHNLKGMGGGFGFMIITDLATQLEQLLCNARYAEMNPFISELETILLRIQMQAA